MKPKLRKQLVVVAALEDHDEELLATLKQYDAAVKSADMTLIRAAAARCKAATDAAERTLKEVDW